MPMQMIHGAAFDRLAEEYDSLWSDRATGVHQRQAVWTWIDPLLRADGFVLDLGCGTGIDALHLESFGVYVYGIDSSPKMVEITRRRGIDAHCRAIEDIGDLKLDADGVISNFGALNCVASLPSVATSLARIVRPGGYAALCLLNRVCLWEIAYYMVAGKAKKALRRIFGKAASSSLGIEVRYPRKREIVSAFRPAFRLMQHSGIGLLVPPSYVTGLGDLTIARLARIDRSLAHRPLLRSLADHSLYIFQRL